MRYTKTTIMACMLFLLSEAAFAQTPQPVPQTIAPPPGTTFNAPAASLSTQSLWLNSMGMTPDGKMAIPADAAAEIKQVTPDTTLSAGEKSLLSLFHDIDKDHNDLISKTEFSAYYKSQLDDPRFNSYDTNRDDFISYFEFRAPNAAGGSVTVPRP